MDSQRRHRRRRQAVRPSLWKKLQLESLEDRRMLATLTVTNLDDAGTGSLRQAILDANNQVGADTIDFDPGLFASPQSMSLLSALPTIEDEVTIDGPGAELLTLSAGHGTDNLPGTGDGYRLLNIDNADSGNVLNVTIEGLTMTGGDVAGAGGAIRSRENLTIVNTAIVANATGPGLLGTAGASGQSGSAGGRGGDGGGIFITGGNLTIIDSTISGNSTGGGGNGGRGGDGIPQQHGGRGGSGGNGGYGGGIFTDGGDLAITNSTLSGNFTGPGGAGGAAGRGGESSGSAPGGDGGNGGDGGYGGNGGGIYSSVGEVTITGSTISGNVTGGGGAGAQGADGGQAGADGDGGFGGSGGSGGGLYSVEGALSISHSTITVNEARSGGSGGLGGAGGSAGDAGGTGNGGGVESIGNDAVLLVNTLIAANLANGQAPDLRTGAVTLEISYSLIGNGDGLQISHGTGSQIGTTAMPVDPQLGPLANNGGPTQTHALLPASPAIDAGDPSLAFDAMEFDQRGMPFFRVEDGDYEAGVVIDIGAYESQAPPSADFDQDNDVDGADFFSWQRGFGINIGALPADGNADDDADVDASDLAAWSVSFGREPLTGQNQLSNASPIPLALKAESTNLTLSGIASSSIVGAFLPASTGPPSRQVFEAPHFEINEQFAVTATSKSGSLPAATHALETSPAVRETPREVAFASRSEFEDLLSTRLL